MTFESTHRNVGFVVHHENGVWKYKIENESFGQYSHRDHAISAAIQHIDRMLFEASRSRGR
jgi:hypothetical protein